MNGVKKKRHAWACRDGARHLRWCTVCGLYEDTKTLRRESLRSVMLTNRTVYRPMGQPTTFYEKQPACVAPPEGTTVVPPPAYVDVLMGVVEAMAKAPNSATAPCARAGCGHPREEHTPSCTTPGPCRDTNCDCGDFNKRCGCKAFVAPGTCRSCGRADHHGPWCEFFTERDERGTNEVLPEHRAGAA